MAFALQPSNTSKYTHRENVSPIVKPSVSRDFPKRTIETGQNQRHQVALRYATGSPAWKLSASPNGIPTCAGETEGRANGKAGVVWVHSVRAKRLTPASKASMSNSECKSRKRRSKCGCFRFQELDGVQQSGRMEDRHWCETVRPLWKMERLSKWTNVAKDDG